MRAITKRLANYLPERWQQRAKRFHFARQIRRGVFTTSEPEYSELGDFLSPGDWVIDIGANVGHYTLRMSELVRSDGRVFAFEPIPPTFELLTANCALSHYRNVTLLNLAASDSRGIVTMKVPQSERTGGPNYYEAHISNEGIAEGCWNVFTLEIDTLGLPHRVSLVKIDAEGHELQVIRGMTRLIECHRPILVVEGNRAEPFLESLGYHAQHHSGSPNYVWRPTHR
jgi:FkbM family methyltransferase